MPPFHSDWSDTTAEEMISAKSVDDTGKAEILEKVEATKRLEDAEVTKNVEATYVIRPVNGSMLVESHDHLSNA